MDYLSETIEAIHPILKAYGMKKTALNWYYENETIFKIFNIQKSQFSKKIYLNIGIKLKAIEPVPRRIYPGSHLSTRLDHLISPKYLDFENKVSSRKRIRKISELIRSNPYEFFALQGNVEELRRFASERTYISARIKQLLDLEEDENILKKNP
jgi:hypothetical protein